jgi:uncharacterized protein
MMFAASLTSNALPLVITIVVAMLISPGVKAQENWAAIRERVKDSVVFVEALKRVNNGVDDLSEGTGFVISGQGDIMTAAHVITGYDSRGTAIPYDSNKMTLTIYVRKAESSIEDRISATLVQHIPDVDLAIIRVLPAQTWSPVCIKNSEITQDEADLYTLGYPVSFGRDTRPSLSSARGNLVGRYNQKWRTSVQFGGGYSGGPVFDAEGAVVGVCQGRYADEEATFVVPTAFARLPLDGAHLPPPGQCSSRSAASPSKPASPSIPIGTASERPSFDCETNRSPAEQAICGNSELARLDGRIAQLYDGVRRSVAPSQLIEIRDQQRDWIKAREACGRDVSCIRGQYQRRITELNAAGTDQSPRPGALTRPSFDCATNRLPSEQAVCRSPKLAALDQALDRLYRDLQSRLPAPLASQVKQGQREWIATRDACGSEVGCLSSQYQRRLAQLEASLTGEHVVLSARVPPSFDCKRETGDAELAICNDTLLSALDARMARLYYANFERLDGSGQRQLRATQINWLRMRGDCKAERTCLKNRYEERIEQLDKPG